MSDAQGPKPPRPDEVVNVTDVIAKAIRKADTRYFWENYDRQAEAVIKALRAEGFLLVPRVPSEPMVEAGASALRYGRSHKGSVVNAVYQAMVHQRPDQDRSPLRAIARRKIER